MCVHFLIPVKLKEYLTKLRKQPEIPSHVIITTNKQHRLYNERKAVTTDHVTKILRSEKRIVKHLKRSKQKTRSLYYTITFKLRHINRDHKFMRKWRLVCRQPSRTIQLVRQPKVTKVNLATTFVIVQRQCYGQAPLGLHTNLPSRGVDR